MATVRALFALSWRGVSYTADQEIPMTGWTVRQKRDLLKTGAVYVDQTSPTAATEYDFTSSATWTVPHGLGRRPFVEVLDDTGETLLADIEYPDLNTVVVTHAAPLAGTVLIL